MALDLTGLKQEVAELKTAKASAIALLRGIKQKLDEAGEDQAKIDELKAELDAETNELANAVVENTPAETNPPTEPTPPTV